MIIPAIDLMDGGVVRLYKGDFDQRTNYAADPFALLEDFAKAGARRVHIVDLDGARNKQAAQTDLILKLAQTTDLKVQTGGGLREKAQIETLLAGGVERVVIGSLAIREPERVRDWMGRFGPQRIVLALDVVFDLERVPRPAIDGWTKMSEVTLWQVIEDFLAAGLTTILVTDIARDGALSGANKSLYQRILRRYPELELITSGGVGTLEDVRELKALAPAGIIIGKALYEGRLTLQEAITCSPAV